MRRTSSSWAHRAREDPSRRARSEGRPAGDPGNCTSATSLLTALTKAYGGKRFEDKLKFYTMARLLVIDEIGYVPIDRHAPISSSN